MGRDPYRTPWDVWAEKTGRLAPDENESEAAEIGSALEPGILALASKRIGEKVLKARGTYVRGCLRANVDGMVGKSLRGSPIVEAKLTADWDAYGKDGTPDIPERVLIQVHHQMWCAESDLAYVAAFRAGFRLQFTLHPIKRDEALVRTIVRECEGFWKNHVLKGIEPPRSFASPAALEAVVRVPGKVIDVDRYLVARLVAAKEAAQRADRAHDELKAEVITALGDAENAQAGDYVVSYRPVERKTIDGDRLRRELPAIAEQFTKTTSSRRFECRNVRAGGVVE